MKKEYRKIILKWWIGKLPIPRTACSLMVEITERGDRGTGQDPKGRKTVEQRKREERIGNTAHPEKMQVTPGHRPNFNRRQATSLAEVHSTNTGNNNGLMRGPRYRM